MGHEVDGGWFPVGEQRLMEVMDTLRAERDRYRVAMEEAESRVAEVERRLTAYRERMMTDGIASSVVYDASYSLRCVAQSIDAALRSPTSPGGGEHG